MEGAYSGAALLSDLSSQEEKWYYATVSSSPPKRPAGRTKFRETRHPVYKGVRRRGAVGRWVSEVREPNKKSRIWLGTFPTAEMAARAHDVAAMMLRGRAACLNFADSAWLLQVPPSFSSPRDIARAAAEAAEAFRQRSDSPAAASAAFPSSMESSEITPPSPKSPMSSVTTPTSSSPEEGTICGALDAMRFDDLDLGYCYYSGMPECLLLEQQTNGGYNWDDLDACTDLPLWSYSV